MGLHVLIGPSSFQRPIERGGPPGEECRSNLEIFGVAVPCGRTSGERRKDMHLVLSVMGSSPLNQKTIVQCLIDVDRRHGEIHGQSRFMFFVRVLGFEGDQRWDEQNLS